MSFEAFVFVGCLVALAAVCGRAAIRGVRAHLREDAELRAQGIHVDGYLVLISQFLLGIMMLAVLLVAFNWLASLSFLTWGIVAIICLLAVIVVQLSDRR